MKQTFLKTTMFLLMLSAFCSCSEDASMDESLGLDSGRMLESISITGHDFQLEEGARSSVAIDKAGVNFMWVANDTVGIFPNTGSQAEFVMDEGAGMQTATFNGGGWALKASSTYSAYYPYNFYNRNLKRILVRYEGQVQTGNASTAHLGAYDFMAAGITTPSNGAVAFDMQHMGALVMLQADLGEAKKLTNVALKASSYPAEFATSAHLNLTSVNPEISTSLYKSTLNIALKDFEVAANETSTIYFMLAPTNLEGETLVITLWDESGAYIKFETIGKNFESGKAYAYTLTNGEKLNISKPEYAVDLGLPSGTLWADRNVGADAPEYYGDYFAWGEVTPKSEYSWSTYKWCDGTDDSMNKYCTDSSCGVVDGKITLDLEDDAAYVNMGSEWCMPTKADIEELYDNCIATWTTQNGVYGVKVTGPNGNSIFLPAAGRCFSSYVGDIGLFGYYWTSSLQHGLEFAFLLYFDDNNFCPIGTQRRYGYPVRAVVR